LDPHLTIPSHFKHKTKLNQTIVGPSPITPEPNKTTCGKKPSAPGLVRTNLRINGGSGSTIVTQDGEAALSIGGVGVNFKRKRGPPSQL
jgi:hypothetical protein